MHSRPPAVSAWPAHGEVQAAAVVLNVNDAPFGARRGQIVRDRNKRRET